MLPKGVIPLKKVLHAAGTVLKYLFLAAAAALLLLICCGFRFYVVTTGSMSPAIPVGSVCVVNRNTPFSEIRAGDVISFRTGDRMLVTHRAVRIEEEGIITKGDANNSEDAPVTEETYLGKIVLSIPKLGYAAAFLRSTAGIVTVSMLAVILLISVRLSKEKE